jgi:hypothetical protein
MSHRRPRSRSYGRNGAGGGEEGDLRRTAVEERLGARGGGGAGREHVVDQQDPRRGAVDRGEHPAHRLATGVATPPSLWTGISDPREQARRMHAEPGGNRERESPCLVVTAGGESRA